ncbi:hypothetical protein RRG08_063442 [Elysia crispata]|uniref:Uncharacterized protein n=1 Tax=Elysia crispata TaxID=231223 RepID=A0AAE1DUQ5_9GAST|nr:hypothetical protein RRG08_063442 [Elysia crispata]
MCDGTPQPKVEDLQTRQKELIERKRKAGWQTDVEIRPSRFNMSFISTKIPPRSQKSRGPGGKEAAADKLNRSIY